MMNHNRNPITEADGIRRETAPALVFGMELKNTTSLMAYKMAVTNNSP